MTILPMFDYGDIIYRSASKGTLCKLDTLTILLSGLPQMPPSKHTTAFFTLWSTGPPFTPVVTFTGLLSFTRPFSVYHLPTYVICCTLCLSHTTPGPHSISN
uniref:Uncharacterized protein n=1 Tax=Anguilla anguilla TaxID=7936 RepID=A0A0E9XNM1_ANGAN